jgi:hypothetical protein
MGGGEGPRGLGRVNTNINSEYDEIRSRKNLKKRGMGTIRKELGNRTENREWLCLEHRKFKEQTHFLER